MRLKLIGWAGMTVLVVGLRLAQHPQPKYDPGLPGPVPLQMGTARSGVLLWLDAEVRDDCLEARKQGHGQGCTLHQELQPVVDQAERDLARTHDRHPWWVFTPAEQKLSHLYRLHMQNKEK